MLTLYKVAVLAAIAGACILTAAEAQSERGEAAASGVIRVGTRLVEVEVVVRDKQGPVAGLTADDFTLFDQGKRQKISVFSGTGPVSTRAAEPLPAGTVSNRSGPSLSGRSLSGRSIEGATVLLFDQLNTSFDHQGYARAAILKYLQSAVAGEKIAIYMLGKDLSILQDFTGDRVALTGSVQRWNPANGLLLLQSTENMDAVDREMYGDNPVYRAIRAARTSNAIAKIVQHLSGMPGRRNLVWLSDTPASSGVPFLSAANIHLYPVLVRGVGSSGVFGWMRDARESGLPGMAVGPALPAGNELRCSVPTPPSSPPPREAPGSGTAAIFSRR